jgi:uracil-DNA glycosylase
MAKLAARLEKELSDWRQSLPTGWKKYFKDVELNFDRVDPEAEIAPSQKIWPRSNPSAPGAHVFKALKSVAPAKVKAIIFGNDPYTREAQATGRSFEQGDLTDWATDISKRWRVAPSLKSILCAVAATDEENSDYDLLSRVPIDERRREWVAHAELARGLADGRIKLRPPKKIFDYWSNQGVLWLNRTLTYSGWSPEHRRSHTALWAPFILRTIEVIAEQAASNNQAVVFALWGGPAKNLRKRIEKIAAKVGGSENLVRFTEAGHPQLPNYYFEPGNPIEMINQALGEREGKIDWL